MVDGTNGGSPNCNVGAPCGSACIPKSNQCNSEVGSKATEALDKLKEKIVSKAKTVKEKAVPEGSKREKAAKLAAEKIDEDTVKEALTNLGGLVGGIAGGASLGPVGGLLGDVGGAFVARSVVETGFRAKNARTKLKEDEAYTNASKVRKAGLIAEATVNNIREDISLRGTFADDMTGWAAANVGLVGLNRFLPQSAKIPMRGAAIAMASVPLIAKQRKKILGFNERSPEQDQLEGSLKTMFGISGKSDLLLYTVEESIGRITTVAYDPETNQINGYVSNRNDDQFETTSYGVPDLNNSGLLDLLYVTLTVKTFGDAELISLAEKTSVGILGDPNIY